MDPLIGIFIYEQLMYEQCWLTSSFLNQNQKIWRSLHKFHFIYFYNILFFS